MDSFVERLDAAMTRNRSLLCVGLDPWPSSMPIDDIAAFNRAIIDATADLVCAYKPNFAFYEAEGIAGLEALRQTIEAAPDGVPMLLDAKRGDLGNTAIAYAKAAFEVWGADAVTVNPYLGGDAVEPFLAHEDRHTFVLCRTSNAGAGELQDRALAASGGGGSGPLYLAVAERANAWNTRGNVGLVVGATYPEEARAIRELCPDLLFLMPGVGAQAGELEAAVHAALDARGGGIIVNASRSVLYPQAGSAAAARAEAQRLRDAIREAVRSADGGGRAD